MRPAFDELPLQLTLLGMQHPVTGFTPHLVAGRGEARGGTLDGVRPRRPTEPLVVGPLVPVHEITNRVVILLVGLSMVVFGFQNFLNDLGSFRAPSLIPLATYTASVPISGALIVLFSLEQIINGWRHGFEGPEDADDFAGIVK